jgi:antitoxin VapB
MTTTRVFRSGNSQAVRIPKEFAFPEGAELEIVREGDTLMLTPRRASVADVVRQLAEMRAPLMREALARPDWPEKRAPKRPKKKS